MNQDEKIKVQVKDPVIVNNPLGYSVIHEYHKKSKKIDPSIRRNSNLLRNKQSTIWIKDESASKCFNCQVDFTLLNRKHHCRNCGNIFCNECTPYRKEIPITWNHQNEQGSVRLCKDCSDQVDLLEPLDKLIQVFSLMVPNLETLSIMAQVCHSWNNLSHYFLGKMRNIQYKPLNEDFTDLEKQILWTNKKYWIGHSHWILLFLRSIDYNSYHYRTQQHQELLRFIMSLNQPPKYNCLNLMCTRNCCQQLLPYHAIILLDHSCRKPVCKELEQFLFTLLKKMTKEEISLYLPFLVHKLVYQKIDGPNSWGDFLIEQCHSDTNLAVELYWNLTYRKKETRHSIYQYYLNKLLDIIPDSSVKQVNGSYAFVKTLEGIPKSNKGYDLYEIKNYFRKINLDGMYLTFDTDFEITQVFVPKINIKHSATNPILVPLRCKSSEDEVNLNIIYKFEDVKKDYVILKAIKLMKYFLKTYENIDLETVDYDVTPIDNQTGIIEIVPKCQTAYEIKKKFSIWNYIVENNPNETVETLRQKFVRSCATYCVVTYLLGVGDRHLDNIMITEDGKLFHIDYGFILGADPKPLSQPKIRITQDMVDALGGFQGRHYQEFKILCNKIYQGLRGHLNLFIVLLSILCHSGQEYEQVVELLTSRFMPGETRKSAIIQLESEIQRSTQQTNFSEVISDFFHYHNKEHTIQSVMENTQYVTHNVMKGSVDIGKKAYSMLNQWWK